MGWVRYASFFALAACSTACGARDSLSVLDTGGGGSNDGSAGNGSGSGGGAGSTGSVSPSACAPELFGMDGSGATLLEVDATHAYFTTRDDRLVRARFGGGPEEVLVEGRPGLGGIRLFGDFVYFSDQNVIARVPKAGGAVEDLTLLDLGTSYSIDVDDTGIYWMAGSNGLFETRIERLSPEGERSTLAENIDFGMGISIAGDHVVIAAHSLTKSFEPYNVVGAVPKLGGNPAKLLAQDLQSPKIPFARGEYVYWLEESDEAITNHGGIARVPQGGGAREKMVTLDGDFPIWGATDGERFYLTAILGVNGRTGLLTAPFPEGGAPSTLAESAKGEFYTEVEATEDRIVWTVQRQGDAAEIEANVRVLCKDAVP